MSDHDSFFTMIGKLAVVGAVLFVFLCAILFVNLAAKAIDDQTPAFTIQPDSSTVTDWRGTRKVSPETAARKP